MQTNEAITKEETEKLIELLDGWEDDYGVYICPELKRMRGVYEEESEEEVAKKNSEVETAVEKLENFGVEIGLLQKREGCQSVFRGTMDEVVTNEIRKKLLKAYLATFD